MVVSRTGEEAMAFPLTPVACRCNSSVTTGNVQMTHSYLQLERSQISCLDKVLLHKQRWGDRDALTRSLKLRKVCTNTSMFVRAALAPGVENTGKQAPNRLHQFLKVQGVCYRPPGTQLDLLNNVSFSLAEKSLGLVYGRSGSGKTTLLQVLAGLATPTEGTISVGSDSDHRPLSSKVGIVFQFPERYFLADSIVEELTFGWSRRMEDMASRQQLAMRLQAAVFAVGLADIPLDTNPRALSDGYKRRLALAVQLVRFPDLLLLDEPLAGLDWKARADVVRLLWGLKRERTLIVVSHDLKELTPLVDRAWQMEMGGLLKEQPWPPVALNN